jgi:hypothetical protein
MAIWLSNIEAKILRQMNRCHWSKKRQCLKKAYRVSKQLVLELGEGHRRYSSGDLNYRPVFAFVGKHSGRRGHTQLAIFDYL